MQQKHNLQKKKILFIVPSLAGGGAERVLMNIITNLDNNKYDISLVLFEKKGHYISSVPSYVNVYDLNKHSRYSTLKVIFLLSRILKKTKPDTVVSFLNYANLVTIISKILIFGKFKLIIGIRSHMSKKYVRGVFKRLAFFMYQKLYKYANCIIVNSLDSKKHLLQLFNLDSNLVQVIYNPLDFKIIDKQKNEVLNGILKDEYILAVGRLSDEKGFSYLLKAYNLIKEKTNKKLVILGQGPNELPLKRLAKDLGIQERVRFLGFQNNPYQFMKNASIFVLPSLTEGFPNVLIEAMACGVPVISTDCPTGPNEIIVNGRNGFLVPPADPEKLAEAVLKLLTDNFLRNIFSESGRKKAEEYSVENILPQYEKLFCKKSMLN